MGSVEIRLLGPIAVLVDGVDVTPSQPKLRQLVGLLAFTAGAVVPHDAIARELWDGPGSPRRTRIVQTYVSQLRSLLCVGAGPEMIEHVPQVGYRLTELGRCDVHEVDRLRRLATTDPERSVDALEEAVGLCRGPALSDVPTGPVLAQRRRHLDLLARTCLEQLVDLHTERGDPAAVLTHYQRIVVEGMRSDHLHARLIAALGAIGRADDAVRLFHEVRQDAVDRTGLEPGDAVQQAYLAVLHQAAAPAQPAAPAQLPLPPATFIGFGPELASARAALGRAGEPGRGPVLAVVGGPGAGKTAFCTQLANQVAHLYPGGQLHTDLAAHTPAEALAGFLRAVAGDRAELPEHPTERVRLFRRLTSARPVLVLVDNVVDVDRVTALQPGSPAGAMILACRRRSWADTVTDTVELRAADDRELTAMLAARVGAERLARDPEAARMLVKFCCGLPVAGAAMGALLGSRPHWTPAQLVERLTDGTGDPIELVLGVDELVAAVERTLGMLPETYRTTLLQLTRRGAGIDPCSAARLAETAGVRVAEAEEMLEEAVALRLADPTTGADGEHHYQVHPLYRLAAAEWRRRHGAG